MRCSGRNKQGAPCGLQAIEGGSVCWRHGGRAPQTVAKAQVRAEVMRWGLDQPDVDPGHTLLKLVAQSAARAERYAVLLEQAYEAAERLRSMHEAGKLLEAGPEVDSDEEAATIQAARDDLDRIFTTGGVAALVGVTRAASPTGSVYETGEAIRGLALLEAQERDRCATFCQKAIAAGLAERQVRLAERQGALIAEVLRSIMNDPQLALTADQKLVLPDVGERHLAIVG